MSAKSENVKKLAVMAMFTAIAAVLITLVHFPLFPMAAFLQYDPADVPILVTAFAYGPVAGLVVTVLASFIQAFLLGGDGAYGFLMHVIATGILVLVSSVIYRKLHTRAGAVVGLVVGTLAMGVGMMAANHFITPFFMMVPTEVVDGMLLPVILPFNLLKAGINSVITFVVYKAISRHIVHGKDFTRNARPTGQVGSES
nr:ECF transporter S component [uncultured Flavonifractor sp.]